MSSGELFMGLSVGDPALVDRTVMRVNTYSRSDGAFQSRIMHLPTGLKKLDGVRWSALPDRNSWLDCLASGLMASGVPDLESLTLYGYLPEDFVLVAGWYLDGGCVWF